MTMHEQLATAFGIGRLPKAPGTAASFAAILIAIPVMWLAGFYGIAALAIIVTGAGIWISDVYGQQTGIADPQDCVIDEFAGQWIACAVMALSPTADTVGLTAVRFLVVFLLFRLFDIAKPWPVKKAEDLPGGIGIMADDVVAGLIAGFVVYLIDYSGFL
jgi:phosphatidylglycerophosphatase A